ncbi:hypothetical protein MYSTI_00226 [Myxococcus stipitatus DSM 14675]|uniref:Uncharacterized protein n=1 Tax=Myxococcus stipitatus (strain DSM 14675 / JCM 12634 / Mx s8) TaxID=1278073 RepID=L7U142_MYXSD|nr:hypothetical protein [Myxococcus stipitatus]AGC41585.1 hypothetical protein MYSTI_00226 [Myxococcus stipitatus DSM 14675]
MTNSWLEKVVVCLCVGLLGACAPERDGVGGTIPAPAPPTPGVSLPEVGDYEAVPLAACKVRPKGSTTAECGSLESFDLSGCDSKSLLGLRTEGFFNMRMHRSDIVENELAATLRPGDFTVDRGASAAHPMFRRSTNTYSDGRVAVVAQVGCSARGTDVVTGCELTCINGVESRSFTFEGTRIRRRAGEGESGGELPLVGEAATGPGMATDVYVTKGHAYVVSLDDVFAGDGGLYVFDIKDRKAPRLVATVRHASENYWNSVWAKDDALYIASGDRGILVFDISQPANPRFVRDLSNGTRQNVHTVQVDGSRLYATLIDPTLETLIYDVKNPREPVLLGRYLDESVGSLKSMVHDTTSFEGRLYVNHWSAGMLILDPTDPANVKKVGAYKYPRASSHAARVGRINGNLTGFEGGEGWGAHLRVLDLADEKNPRLIGEYKLSPEVSIHNMELVGSRLYLAHYQHGVRVLDVSGPAKPVELAYYNTWRETDANRGTSPWDGAIGIRVPGDGYVYVVDTSRGLLIFPEVMYTDIPEDPNEL